MRRYQLARLKQLCHLGIDARYLLPVLLEELADAIRALGSSALISNERFQITRHHRASVGTGKFPPLHEQTGYHPTDRSLWPFWENWLRNNDKPVNTTALQHMSACDPVSSEGNQEFYFDNHVLALPVKTPHTPFGILLFEQSRCERDFNAQQREFLLQLLPDLQAGLTRKVEEDHYVEDSESHGVMLLDEHANLLYTSGFATSTAATLTKRVTFHQPHCAHSDYSQFRDYITALVRSYLYIPVDTQPQHSAAPHILRTTQGHTFRLYPNVLRASTSQGMGTLFSVTFRHLEPYTLRIWKQCNLLKLTVKQTQICLYVAEGYTYDVIADRMSISKHTVIDHIKTVFGKLGVNNRIELLKKLTTYTDSTLMRR